MRRKMSRRRFVDGSIRLALVAPLIQLRPLDASAPTAPRIGTPERRTLRAAADVIIPAQDRMPAPSAVGAVDDIARIARAEQQVGSLLVEGLLVLDAQAVTAHGVRFDLLTADLQTEIVAQFEKSNAPAGFFPALRDLVYEAYYTNPRVMRLIGYRFRTGRRRTAPLEPFDEQRLARVRAMPPLVREVPS